jgi:hypothetical protein
VEVTVRETTRESLSHKTPEKEQWAIGDEDFRPAKDDLDKEAEQDGVVSLCLSSLSTCLACRYLLRGEATETMRFEVVIKISLFGVEIDCVA